MSASSKSAVICLRVSSAGQVNKAHNPEGYSIPGQREACKRHARMLDADVIAEFVDPGRTGTNTRRPALQKMLAELPRLKPTYVIFYDLSRMAREEFDAFWLLNEIKRHGAKLESTLEPIDDSPQGLLMFAIMAGVNAFRSRGDAEKVKMGHERKFADGGSHGPARTGYLNVRELVDGREVASIATDPERADFIKLAFDLAATGEHTITTITYILKEAGLRTRPTRTRPSRSLSRSMVHRILRDDYYTGIVTRGDVKRQGRHDALIDRDTFDRVQQVLTSHRASGDRSQKHQHYLNGSVHCGICEKRLGYGRHRGNGGVYEYFSCLSRMTKDGPCTAPYFRVQQVERAIERRYETVLLTSEEQNAIRDALRNYVKGKSQLARKESDRHALRLRTLTAEQQKLVQLYYKDGVSEEVLKAEQSRIDAERADARRWARVATAEVEDVMQALDDALALIDLDTVPYILANPTERRLINQGLFWRLLVMTVETVQAVLSPLYAQLVALARQPAQPTGQPASTAGKGPKKNRGPGSLGPRFALLTNGGEGGIRTRDGV